MALVEDYSKHPYFTQTGEDREGNDDQYIANMRDGAVAGFKYFDLRETGKIRLELSGDGVGEMLISSGPEEKAVSRIPVGAEKKELVGTLFASGSRVPLFFRFKGEGAINLHGFELIKK